MRNWCGWRPKSYFGKLPNVASVLGEHQRTGRVDLDINIAAIFRMENHEPKFNKILVQ